MLSISLVCVLKETEHLQSILDMVCICTFSVCPLEMLQMHYLFYKSLREVMFLYGIGYKRSTKVTEDIHEKDSNCRVYY